MDASFPACLAVILQSEGGYVWDNGGPTNHGVTLAALQTWLRRPCTPADVRALTADGPIVGPLYRADYWNVAHCPELPAGLDLMVFDEAVNEGVGRAIRHLQEALGVAADGLFGPRTSLAVKGLTGVRGAIQRLHDGNAGYYRALGDAFPKYEDGWQARNDRTMDVALKMLASA